MTDEYENLTFDEAMKAAQEMRSQGLVGISIFHRHEYEKIDSDEGCYVVHAYTKGQLAEIRKEAEIPEEPMPPFEICKNYLEDDGLYHIEVIHHADTLEELLKYDPVKAADDAFQAFVI